MPLTNTKCSPSSQKGHLGAFLNLRRKFRWGGGLESEEGNLSSGGGLESEDSDRGVQSDEGIQAWGLES